MPRFALRQSRIAIQRRAASSTSEAAASGANKAKQAGQEAASKAQETASKAQEGLSRVQSSATEKLSSAGSALSKSLAGIGGRTGQLISFVNSMVPPTIYYGRVVGELGKMAVQGRNMAPPTLQTVQTYLQPVTKAIQNPSAFLNRAPAPKDPQSFLNRVRDMDPATLKQVGIVTAEVIGFFSVGEMLGRFKIVGYRSEAPHAH